MSFLDNLFDVFPSLGSRIGIAGILVGWIFVLLSFFVEPLKRKDRFGHPEARMIIALSLLICMVVLCTKLSLWWLFLGLIPFLWLAIRWVRLSSLEKRFSLTNEDRDKAGYEYVDKLSNKNLFQWEIQRFLLPQLIIFFEVGAIIRLKGEIDKRPNYRNNKYIVELKALILSIECKPREMEVMLRNRVKDKKFLKLDPKNILAIINLYHASMTLEDVEVSAWVFRHMENFFAAQPNPDKVPFELYDALLYRYDMESNTVGIKKVMAKIKSCHPTDFQKYLDLNDIILHYNRRHNNRKAILEYIDESYQKLDQLERIEERRIIFRLRMVAAHIEYDYKWKELTDQFFQQADYYLSYSKEVALEYTKMLATTFRDSQSLYNLSLASEKGKYLIDKAVALCGSYMESHINDLVGCEDELLYRKIKAYRELLEYNRLKHTNDGDIIQYMRKLDHVYSVMIELCRKNGEIHELIHTIVANIDDFIALDRSVRYSFTLPSDKQPVIINKLDINKKSIETLLTELQEMLNQYKWNRGLAYYTMYASYFCQYFGRVDDARFLMDKFDSHNIDIKTYRRPVQTVYYAVKVVQGETVPVDAPSVIPFLF